MKDNGFGNITKIQKLVALTKISLFNCSDYFGYFIFYGNRNIINTKMFLGIESPPIPCLKIFQELDFTLEARTHKYYLLLKCDNLSKPCKCQLALVVVGPVFPKPFE